MRAAIYTGIKSIELVDIDAPTINDHEVLIDVAACGICGSDLHMYREDWKPEKCTLAYPGGRVPGHEFAGTVAAIGDQVTGTEPGDRVVGISLGGGMAQQVAVYNTPFTLHKIPDSVSFAEAATTEPMANSLRIARLSEPKEGENVVVFGMGTIGLGVIQAYRATGTRLNKLIAVDVSDSRLDKALEIGADHAINPEQADLISAVAKLCGERTTVLGEQTPAVDIVCDCVGYIKKTPGPVVLQTALDLIGDLTGRIMCFGIFEADVQLNLHNLVFRQPQLIGVMGYEPRDISDALAMMADGRIDRASLVTHQFTLDQAAEAFRVQDSYAESIKVILLPQ